MNYSKAEAEWNKRTALRTYGSARKPSPHRNHTNSTKTYKDEEDFQHSNVIDISSEQEFNDASNLFSHRTRDNQPDETQVSKVDQKTYDGKRDKSTRVGASQLIDDQSMNGKMEKQASDFGDETPYVSATYKLPGLGKSVSVGFLFTLYG